MKRILLTGAAGNIGKSLREHLKNHYYFRCLDIKPVPEAAEAIAADITDFNAVRSAMHEIDAAIHLAANPNIDQPWEDVYTSGIAGTYNVFEAARQAGITKIIYASTNHVSGWREIEGEKMIAPDLPVRPDSLYGVGKAFGEALGRFFVDKYEMSVICLRIGSFVNKPKRQTPGDRLLQTWCSPRDLAQLVRRSIDGENLGFQVFYGVSGNTHRFWDISNARDAIGYQPEDNAQLLL